MSKEYYTAGEIIMGTRSEYLKIENDLLKLKNLVYSDDIHVDDFYFEIMKLSNRGLPEVVCKFIQNPKNLRLIELFSKEGKDLKIEELEKGLLTLRNGRYEINNPLYNVSIIKGKESEFTLLIKKIINSCFANNITLYGLYNKREPDTYMTLTTSGSVVSHYTQNGYHRIIYSSKNDYIIVDSTKKLDNEMMFQLFNFEISADCLPKYHKDIIDNSPSASKPIELCSVKGNIGNKKTRLLVKESEDKISLSKVRKRIR